MSPAAIRTAIFRTANFSGSRRERGLDPTNLGRVSVHMKSQELVSLSSVERTGDRVWINDAFQVEPGELPRQRLQRDPTAL